MQTLFFLEFWRKVKEEVLFHLQVNEQFKRFGFSLRRDKRQKKNIIISWKTSTAETISLSHEMQFLARLELNQHSKQFPCVLCCVQYLPVQRRGQCSTEGVSVGFCINSDNRMTDYYRYN